MISPYLTRPLQTEQQAREGIAMTSFFQTTDKIEYTKRVEWYANMLMRSKINFNRWDKLRCSTQAAIEALASEPMEPADRAEIQWELVQELMKK